MTDPMALRNAFGAFATGVTVITTRQPDGIPRGFTANSFTSVSLDPPLLLVCLAKTAHSADVFAEAPHFAVNILAEIPRRSLCNSLKQRSPSFRYQSTSGVHAPERSRVHSRNEHCCGGGWTVLLRRLTIGPLTEW